MQLYNALQLKDGAKTKKNRMGNLTQPVQFLSKKEKDEEWCAQNMDWLEMVGMKQITRKARKMLKNVKLANGIIDKSDYIVEDDNEVAEMIDILTKEDQSAVELRFFPIIPNVINVLVTEFAKRNDKISYRAVDDLSYNEMLAAKSEMIEGVLLQYAEQKMLMQMQQMGVDMKSEQGQQMLAPENLKTLPEIEDWFKKGGYKAVCEEWAEHQHETDTERFRINELEATAFKEMLSNNGEFWHFQMYENDYDVELWNPVTTFYHKSPDVQYVSQGNYVGNITLMTVADVIDKFGYMMTTEQLESLEEIYPVKSIGYVMPNRQNDGGFYDSTRSHEWNVTGPSLAMRQFTSAQELSGGFDVIDEILTSGDSIYDSEGSELLRVSQIYWKSRKKIGHLTKIDEEGVITKDIVSEDYQITDKPVYANISGQSSEKRVEDLIQGEHLEWIWINEVYGGLKIGPNHPTSYGQDDHDGLSPIYLNVKPLRFQFKGDHSIYGCKLPVEGAVFSARNSESISLVDRMKPYQIGYNLVNNQISDILIDELGTVIMLDQNTLPKHSMGEDWGENNMAKAYVAMKDFQILPVDTSLQNTEAPLNFQHYQVLNLDQTNRLLSRVNLATFFKAQAFESIGITPQRLGAVTAQETAKGVEQAINQSYSQTEIYFTQHSEYLMPRVHQMRTDLSQYYHSNSPSERLSYITSMDERVNFEINGTDLLLRDLNVFVTTKVNHKYILEQIRNLSLQNNTAGASIYDLGNIVKADSLAEVTRVLKSIEEKANKTRQEQNENQLEQERLRQKGESERLKAKQDFEAEQKELDRQKDIAVAELKGAGYQTGDANNNSQSDYLDAIEYLDNKRDKEAELNLKREKNVQDTNIKTRQLDLKQEELNVRRDAADKQLQVARENKNKYDVKKKSK